ncbi:MAG: FAD:protein FMN transferase [Thermomicrobiales bacterium]
MNQPVVHEHRFRSMGTDVEILLMGESELRARQAFSRAELLAGEWMDTFSRFDSESELSRLNSSAGRPVFVSERLFDAVELSVRASLRTGGVFNPLILPALVAHGYDRSFDDPDIGSSLPMTIDVPPGVETLALDRDLRTVLIPPGGAIDLGGIAKGLYADQVASLFAGWPGGVVSAGGDLRAWGEGPDDGRWLVGVEDPGFGRDDIAVVALTDGGVATSGTNRRRWQRGSTLVHHLIDPRTGRPAGVVDRTVTVLAPTAALAEVGATACFIDPECTADRRLSRDLWGILTVAPNRLVSFVDCDPEAPFHVYFDH